MPLFSFHIDKDKNYTALKELMGKEALIYY